MFNTSDLGQIKIYLKLLRNILSINYIQILVE